MGQACTRHTSAVIRRRDAPDCCQSPFSASTGTAHGPSRGVSGEGEQLAGGAAVSTKREQASASSSSLLLEVERCVNTRKRWKPGSSSLVYCLVNNLADRHLAVVFDCREREKYEANHLHYAICPWRGADDAAVALQFFEKHGAPLVTNADLFKNRKGGLPPPVSKSAKANPAARSPRFVFPAFLCRTQTLKPAGSAEAPEQAAESKEEARDSEPQKGRGERTPNASPFLTPQGGGSDSTAASRLAAGVPQANDLAPEVIMHGERPDGEGLQTAPEIAGKAADAGATQPEKKPDRATLAAAAMRRAGTGPTPSALPSQRAEALSGEWKVVSLATSDGASAPRAGADAGGKNAALEKAQDADEEPKRLKALKTWLRTVCKFRTVIVYGEGSEDPLLLVFLNALLDSGARFRDVVVLAGGIGSLGDRYSPLLVTSDLLLPGPLELIPPCKEKAALGARPPSAQEEPSSSGRGSLRSAATRRLLSRSKSLAPRSPFSVFVAYTAKLLHDNEEILRHFGIRVVINLSSAPCPLLSAAEAPAASPSHQLASSASRVRRLVSAAPPPPTPAGFEIYDMPFKDVASFQFERAAAVIRQAKERDLAVLVYDYKGENTVAPGIVAWFLIDEGHGVIHTLNHMRLRLPLVEMNPILVSELHRHAETLAKVPSGAAPLLASDASPAADAPAASARKAKHFGLHALPFSASGSASSASAAENATAARLREGKQAHAEGEAAERAADSLARKDAETGLAALRSVAGAEDAPSSRSGDAGARPVLPPPPSSVVTVGSLYNETSPVSPAFAFVDDGEEEPQQLAPLDEVVAKLLAAWQGKVTPYEAAQSVATLNKILSNVLQHPGDEKYRRVKLANKRFHEAVGCHPELLKLLFLAGFKRHAGGAGIELPCDAPLHKISDILDLLPALPPASPATFLSRHSGESRDSQAFSPERRSTSACSLPPSSPSSGLPSRAQGAGCHLLSSSLSSTYGAPSASSPACQAVERPESQEAKPAFAAAMSTRPPSRSAESRGMDAKTLRSETSLKAAGGCADTHRNEDREGARQPGQAPTRKASESADALHDLTLVLCASTIPASEKRVQRGGVGAVDDAMKNGEPEVLYAPGARLASQSSRRQ
ncbi:PUB domain-containing protein [Besnoitia besnoiti]|uniref:PUB domain-containing protein n=1 Tax=Besnoitia besnoiti TaxID=94643 RepID=A0A2A9MHB8_BESBE|nr:PUB domain-containing protein [Besnoitia besnoiti]PFH37299.1 PUB domain-containing protein [Besnoitia besnoiti]